MPAAGLIINRVMLAMALIIFGTASGIIILGSRPDGPPIKDPHDPDPKVTIVTTEGFGFKGLKLVLEAEDHKQIEAPIEVVKDSTASGGSCIQIRDKAGKTGGRIMLQLHVPKDGIYRLWGRRWWMDACGNSMTFSIQGSPSAVFVTNINAQPQPADQEHMFGDDASYNPVLQEPWLWTRGHLYTLPRGDYTFLIKNREDGVKLDQILLVEDIKSAFGHEYTPVGIEKQSEAPAP